MFLDEVYLEKNVETAIERANLLILYVRHPDVVAEICMYQKATILPIHFGEGFFNQIKASNPKVVQPLSMCNAHPNTGINEIDSFLKKFSSPEYKITINYSEKNQPIIENVFLKVESPCGASDNTLEHLRGKSLTPEILNNFALAVRQECREPMSTVFKREFSETASATHLLNLLEAIEKEEPLLLTNNKILKDYASKIRQTFSSD